MVSGIANLRCCVGDSIQAYRFLPELNLIVSQVHSGRALNLSKWARRRRTFANSTSYTFALSIWAAIGKTNSVLLVYFPKALLRSVMRASRAASLACDTGPASGEPAT